MSQETERYQLENNGNTYLGRAKPSGSGADVEANPEGTATTDLEKLKVGETIYGIPEGTNVVANPTLAGTESALTGLQVGDTKYAVGEHLYEHTIVCKRDDTNQKYYITFRVITNTSTLVSSIYDLNDTLYTLYGSKPIEASGTLWLNTGGNVDGYWNVTNVYCLSNLDCRAKVLGLNNSVASFQEASISLENSGYTTITTRQII